LPLTAVAADLAIAGARAYADFISGRHEAEFDGLWARFDMLRGCEVNVALHEGNLHGRVQGLDPSGGLRLVLADGSRRILQSGDVSLGGYHEKK
jgi:biotin-(acetyl-CoA carboxylase) ligase